MENNTNYKNRIIETKIKDLLKISGCVWIKGVKWCGKTLTATKLSKSQIYMEDYVNDFIYLASIENDPKEFLNKKAPLLIDEWQEIPFIWDTIRREVDIRQKTGQFIITSSDSKLDLSKVKHSGIGRINEIILRPMTLWEQEESTGNISIKELSESGVNFNNQKLFNKNNELSFERIALLACKGGCPFSSFSVVEEKKSLMTSQLYLNNLILRDINIFKLKESNLQLVKTILWSLSRNIATSASKNKITDDVNKKMGIDTSPKTISKYIDELYLLYILEDVNTYNENLRSSFKITKSPTRYFVDPSIACASLNIKPKDLLADLKTFGLIFENMCMRDLRIYAQANDAEIYKYRDKNGYEIDCIIKFDNNKIGLIEIKLGGLENVEKAANNLNKFSEELKDGSKIIFKMVLTAAGHTYIRKDGVLVTPITTLKN